MLGDSALGKEVVKAWYDNTDLSKRGVSLSEVISYYSMSTPSGQRVVGNRGVAPGFLDAIGGALRDSGLSPERLRAAMRTLAISWSSSGYPESNAFFEALSTERGTWRWSDTAQVAKETITELPGEIKKYAFAGIGIYLVVAAITFAVLLSPKMRKA